MAEYTERGQAARLPGYRGLKAKERMVGWTKGTTETCVRIGTVLLWTGQGTYQMALRLRA